MEGKSNKVLYEKKKAVDVGFYVTNITNICRHRIVFFLSFLFLFFKKKNVLDGLRNIRIYR